jgi:cyclophilin family peptidyl-prolyl cis-trans isomerase
MDRRQLAKAVALGAACGILAGKGALAQEDKSNFVTLQLKSGPVVIRLRPDLAPKHVERIKELAKAGFYDGVVFHRVIEGFMAQTGDPTGTGMGGSKLPNLPAEFSAEPFKRGTLGMARSNSPNSANSQFFICFAPAPFLNGQYTVFGEVVSGMEFVDKIKRGEPPADPDKIISLKLASDA